jgi:hypothetical protein
MSKIGYNQGNNPFKQTLGTHTAPGGAAHGKRAGVNKKNTAARPETEQEREARHKRNQMVTNYLDMPPYDGKVSGWEVGLEAATWLPTLLAIGASSPSGPGALAAGAGVKQGMRKLLQKGIQLFTKTPTRRGLTIGGTGYAKAGDAGNVKKDAEMESSGYEVKSNDIKKSKDATNILDSGKFKKQ